MAIVVVVPLVALCCSEIVLVVPQCVHEHNRVVEPFRAGRQDDSQAGRQARVLI